MFPHKAIPDWCFSHTMCQTAKHVTLFTHSNISESDKLLWKIDRMRLMHSMKRSSNVRQFETFLNALHLASTIKTFDFKNPSNNEFKYISIKDLFYQTEEEWTTFEYDMQKQAQRKCDAKHASAIWQWNDDTLEPLMEFTAEDENEALSIYNWQNDSQLLIEAATNQPNPFALANRDDILTPFPDKLPHFHLQLIQSDYLCTVTILGPNVALPVLKCVSDDGESETWQNARHNENDWNVFLEHYGHYCFAWLDMIVGGSNWQNNTHAELIFRNKKQLKKTLTETHFNNPTFICTIAFCNEN